MSEKEPFIKLAKAVEDVFTDRRQTENFLRMLEQTATKIRDFDRALGELPGPGGAFGPAQRFPVSNYELFGHLDEQEKVSIRKLYTDKVAQLEIGSPELRRSYFAVFNR